MAGKPHEPAFKFKPVLQNRASPNKTAASLTFDLHYAKLGILRRWDWQRYCRLAAFLELTVHELASLLCITHASIDVYRRANRFPGPASLLLTLFEAQAMKDYGADVIEKPFPSHDPSQSS